MIETGVAHGITSRVVLEALKKMTSVTCGASTCHSPSIAGCGRDKRGGARYVPLPVVVPEGASSQRLPPLVGHVGHLEMFIHDSLHTAKNTLFELGQAASVMSPGGVMLVDDIGESCDAFAAFTRRNPQYQAIICPASNWEGGIYGIFGIAVKAATA